ncbi:MAG: hypothetical protein IH840_17620 [Candidatus Heimdallarchaeota archaeon]|nr:hypothetical protein [Candidatus Heimdallarchaeota archaeon]
MSSESFSLLELAQIIGVSSSVSVSISFVLNQWKSRQERASARQENRLKYSIENYPHFATVLADVSSTLQTARNSLVANDDRQELQPSLWSLIYSVGRLYNYDLEFKREQGQMFRLGSQSMEILAKHLYEHGKQNLYLSRSQEIHLAQAVQKKTLDEFKQGAENNPTVLSVVKTLRDEVIAQMYPVRLARKNFDTLSRLLEMEILSIRLPGYERVYGVSASGNVGLKTIEINKFRSKHRMDCSIDAWKSTAIGNCE